MQEVYIDRAWLIARRQRRLMLQHYKTLIQVSLCCSFVGTVIFFGKGIVLGRLEREGP